ncbi:hypothetical protein AVL59_16675 [Streptomyces griseochromogenes]|uniref:Uncharacterized protein n=1 Tax=Streptomyces griseochromogenes TaxID=68214 RepID=A0A1B1AWZ7_9ACTN|nr:hypothetical protein AVL59_16675 [Streptomyces griseochromogenes]
MPDPRRRAEPRRSTAPRGRAGDVDAHAGQSPAGFEDPRAEFRRRLLRHEIGVVDDVLPGTGGEHPLLHPVPGVIGRHGAADRLDALGGLPGGPVGLVARVPLGTAGAQIGPAGAEPVGRAGRALLAAHPRVRLRLHVDLDAPFEVAHQSPHGLRELLGVRAQHRLHTSIVQVHRGEPQRQHRDVRGQGLDHGVVGAGDRLQPVQVLEMASQGALLEVLGGN